jgi:hypothetical protein
VLRDLLASALAGSTTAALLLVFPVPTLASSEVPICTLPQRVQSPRLQPRARLSASVVTESEPNDTQPEAMLLPLGFVPPNVAQLTISGALAVSPPVVLTSSEDDGAIPLAQPTDLIAGHAVQVSATIGDGPYGTSSGDYDWYSVNAVAGQTITVDIDARSLGSSLDSYVGLYNGAGIRLAENDDQFGGNLDSYLSFVTPAADTYFIVVRGFGTGFQTDPFVSSSGPGAGSTGFYTVTIRLDYADIDYFSFDLHAGDVLGVSLNGGATTLSLRDPLGTELIGSDQNVTSSYPDSSPLGTAGRAALSWVVAQPGRYAIRVSDGSGAYALELSLYRPGLKPQPAGSHQVLFLDFDGATVDAASFGGFGLRTLSPLSSYLPGWGLDPAAQDALIDAIVAVVAAKFHTVATAGNNGDFASTGTPGEFDVEIRNSRDHPDPFGQANVSRVVVGGSIAELGIATIGIAESIDVGNFAAEESAVVLLDQLSDPNVDNPNSLNHFALASGVSLVDLVGVVVGNIAAHEAGHLFGDFHTDNASLRLDLMDRGGTLSGVMGSGEDGIFGTVDDIDVGFGQDAFAPEEGFTGTEDTLNVVAFGLSTGTGPVLPTPSRTATSTPMPTRTSTPTQATSAPPSTASPSVTATGRSTITPPPSATSSPTASATPTGIGLCEGLPRVDCGATWRSTLAMQRSDTSAWLRGMAWRWWRGKAEKDDFGAPIELTEYAFCLYDESGLRLSVSIPPGSLCSDGAGCWRTTRQGFRYLDRQRLAQGTRTVVLRSGDGTADISVIASGPNLPMPALPLTAPVTVQLVTGEGRCWGARFLNPSVNTERRFRAG